MFQSNIPQITVEEVHKAIQEKKDILLLDVRTPQEYDNGKIEGSINIPVNNITTEITNKVSDKNKTVYVYCLSGSRSDLAVQIMRQLGYTNAFSMTHGLLMWRSKKLP